MAGLKVRLDDGSDVGPMDLEMVRTWFQQGLIDSETPVQRAGSPRWVRLADVVDLRNWGGSRAAPSRARGAAREAGGGAAGAGSIEGRWRLFVAMGVLFILGLAAFAAAVWPDRARPELDDAPWVRIGLALVAIGLLLVRGWNVGRRMVRITALLAVAAAFPLAGVFVARGVRGEALLALASAWLVGAGLVALLAPSLSRLASAAALLVVAAGLGGLVRFAPAERGTVAAGIAEWSAAEAGIVDAEIGLTVTLPRGWVVLKPGNPIVPAPEHTRATLAQPRLAAYALLLVEPAPPGVLMLEHYLDHVIAERRAAATAYEEEWRRDGRLGKVASRRASNRRGDAEGWLVERVIVARDGDRYFGLVCWAPDAGGGRALEELDALEGAVTLSGLRDARRRDAVQKANLELPHLSLAAIERLVEVLGPVAPAELFRKGVAASGRGRGSLAPQEAQELQALTTAALAGLTPRERARLADYLRRVRVGQSTEPAEDERMRLLLKTGVTRLGPSERTRLGTLNERAIAAAVRSQPTL